jgi:hypothetical protein
MSQQTLGKLQGFVHIVERAASDASVVQVRVQISFHPDSIVDVGETVVEAVDDGKTDEGSCLAGGVDVIDGVDTVVDCILLCFQLELLPLPKKFWARRRRR